MRFLFCLLLALAGFLSSPAQMTGPAAFNGWKPYSNMQDPSAAIYNPAALAAADRLSVSLSTERRFMLISSADISALIPHSGGAFLGRMRFSGQTYHSQAEVGLGYGQKLTEVVRIGIQLGYLMDRMPGYSTTGTPVTEAGIVLKLTDRLITGMHMRKLVSLSGKAALSGDLYEAGIGYEFSKHFATALVIRKQQHRKVACQGGVDYAPGQAVFFSLGFTSDEGGWQFGSGIRRARYNAVAWLTMHPQLGISPGITITFHHKRKDHASVK